MNESAERFLALRDGDGWIVGDCSRQLLVCETEDKSAADMIAAALNLAAIEPGFSELLSAYKATPNAIKLGAG